MPLPAFPLYGTDAAWWKMNHANSRVIITALLRFETRLERDVLIATLERGIAPYPQFRSRTVMKGWGVTIPYWEEVPNFRVASHVEQVNTPAPVTSEGVAAIVGELMSQPLPENQPLWRAHLIEEAEGGTALVFRIHHAIGDGAALVHFLLSLTEGTQNAPVHRRRTSGAAWYEPIRFALSTLITPFALLFMPPEGEHPLHRPLTMEKQVAWSRPIPLDMIKSIGKATDSTVNDVLVAAVVGALRPFLLPHGIQKARAAIPVALRAFGKTPKLENHIGLVFLNLPVGVAEPQARLAQVKQQTERLKRSPQAIITFAILWLAGYLPSIFARGLAWFLGTKITMVMTNVPGPHAPLTLAGGTMAQLMFWVPQAGNCGIGVSLLSYNGAVTVGIATDTGLQVHSTQLISNIEVELQKLANLGI